MISNVLNVMNLTLTVLSVEETELQLQTVSVNQVSMKLMKKTVKFVDINVSLVLNLNLIVKNVLLTESLLQVVTVHMVLITLKDKLNVQFVLINVLLVLIPLITVPPVPHH